MAAGILAENLSESCVVFPSELIFLLCSRFDCSDLVQSAADGDAGLGNASHGLEPRERRLPDKNHRLAADLQ